MRLLLLRAMALQIARSGRHKGKVKEGCEIGQRYIVSREDIRSQQAFLMQASRQVLGRALHQIQKPPEHR